MHESSSSRYLLRTLVNESLDSNLGLPGRSPGTIHGAKTRLQLRESLAAVL